MEAASLATAALWQIVGFAVRSVAVKATSLVKLECMWASASNSDRDRVAVEAFLSATKACCERCRGQEFARHSYDLNTAGDAPAQRI